MSSKLRHCLIVLTALSAVFTSTSVDAVACPPVTEYADMWPEEEGAVLPITMFAYGSVETCGTSLPVDMLLEIKIGSTVLDAEWAYGGYGFIDAYADTQISESSAEGDYIAEVQAWLGEEHFGCYDALNHITAFTAKYRYDGNATIAGITLARYVRCVVGPCQTIYSPGTSSPPAFMDYYVVRVSDGVVAKCFAGNGTPLISC